MSDWSLHPRLQADTHHVTSLALSDVLLMGDTQYPWLILLPRVTGAVEWVDLEAADRHRLLDEVSLAAAALRSTAACDKLNIGALGNVVPQLHVHVIARRVGDPAWPGPVWGAHPPTAYSPDALQARLISLRAAFVGAASPGTRTAG